MGQVHVESMAEYMRCVNPIERSHDRHARHSFLQTRSNITLPHCGGDDNSRQAWHFNEN